jgi:hypothetical protein
MTSLESQKIQDLQADLKKAQDAYNTEKWQNDFGHNNINSGAPYVYPWNNEIVPSYQTYQAWVVNSDASLATKKNIMEQAEKTYNDYKKTIEDRDKLQFAKDNPTIFKDLEAAKIAAQANYATNKTKYIAVAVVVVIVIGVFLFVRFRNKKAVA